jgi:lipoprotein-anchoring transpeptidase ErfK/SrfK
MKLEKRLTLYALTAASMVVGTLISSPLAQAADGSRASASPSNRDLVGAPRTQVANVVFTVKLEDQLLAILRYLPVTFQVNASPSSTTTTTSTTTTLSTTSTTSSTTTTTTLPVIPANTISNPTKLQNGTYVWRFRTLPSTIKQLWRVGSDNVVLQGALMSFQLNHNLTTTGSMNPATWHELVAAALKNQIDHEAYNYVYVRQTLPELLKLYVNGRISYETYVNTGVSAAPTQTGTYPVYERFLTTTMSGVEPDGKPYSDPGIPWVSYFHGGDALHGFIRSGYGYPQSLGCVEMPFAHAAILFPHTPIGTLVTIQ